MTKTLLAGLTISLLAACNAQQAEQAQPNEAENTTEGEEETLRLSQDDAYDQERAGSRLILSYDVQANAFVGTVENVIDTVLSQVRVEVHLSNGTELGPTAPVDLAPGEKADVNLPGSEDAFETWSAHAEVGEGEHGTEHEADEHGAEGEADEHGAQREGREHGAEQENR